MEIIKLYTHEKGEEKDGFRLKLASNKQFNNLSQPSLAADRELDDLKERVKVSQCTEIFGKHEIIEKE